MTEARERIDKIAEELWEFAHRFGRDNMTWETCSGETQQTYRKEAEFILSEFVENLFGYRLPPKLTLITDEEIETKWQECINSTSKGWLKVAIKGIAQAQLADQKAIEGGK